MRRVDEPVEPLAPGRPPRAFRWRGRRYVVQTVLTHWVETGAWWGTPLGPSSDGTDAPGEAEGERYASGEIPIASPRLINGGYLQTMGIPLIAGRYLDSRDSAEASPAAVISESTAEMLWPGRDPIGQRLTQPGSDGPGYGLLVGVVADVFPRRFRHRPFCWDDLLRSACSGRIRPGESTATRRR